MSAATTTPTMISASTANTLDVTFRDGFSG